MADVIVCLFNKWSGSYLCPSICWMQVPYGGYSGCLGTARKPIFVVVNVKVLKHHSPCNSRHQSMSSFHQSHMTAVCGFGLFYTNEQLIDEVGAPKDTTHQTAPRETRLLGHFIKIAITSRHNNESHCTVCFI